LTFSRHAFGDEAPKVAGHDKRGYAVHPHALRRSRTALASSCACPLSSDGVTADVERVRIQDINAAYERMLKGDVKCRFVIETASLAA
jgi:hypothetical protein